jgi:hypothetical protein
LEVAPPDGYCRAIEAYLCQKNDGHLIRIVGPAFDRVCGWAREGIPLKIVFLGVDRYFERYYAKTPRRRPARIEFCDADIRDAFDEWRRAVGVASVSSEDEPDHTNVTLPAHLERVIARLTARRAGEDRSLDSVIGEIVRELDGSRSKAKGLRGDARDRFLRRLDELDRHLLDTVHGRCERGLLDRLAEEADAELAPFRPRMTAETYAQSKQACVDRLLRERLGLPTVAFG